MCDVLLATGLILGYLVLGAVIAGLLQRWDIGPDDLPGAVTVIAWPIVIGILILAGVVMLLYTGLEFIMDKVRGD